MNKEIFRAYDIRGIFNDDLTEETAYLIGRAFGSIIKRSGQEKTVVGYDNRKSSIVLFNELSRGILESGIDVYNIGFCTTPMLYFSYSHLSLNSGVMITASHNPKQYNGFKISFNGLYNAHGNEIEEFREFINKRDFEDGVGELININVKDDYISYLLRNIKINKKLKVVFDAGNGSTTCVIKDVLKKLNIDYTPLYFKSDSDFPNHHPDPSVSKNLEKLREKVIETKSDAGFAFDGDGDRVGMVDNLGNIIEADKIMIIAVRDILSKVEDKRILFDVKCTSALREEIEKLGGIPVESRTGNSYLRAEIVKEKYPLAGEFSGHIFFNDKFSGFDDGIYVALRMIEILSNTNKKSCELLDNISKYYTTDEMKISVTDEKKFEIIEEITNHAINMGLDVRTIDGCKIITSTGFILVRASNTGPELSLRIEDKNENNLKELTEHWLDIVESKIS